MGPSSEFLLVLIGMAFISTHAIPVRDGDSECPPDQVYNECGSACYSPCGERDPDLMCTDQCVPGCFCKPGFTFMQGRNGSKCVPCNLIFTVPETECPPDQEYDECRSACYSPCGDVDMQMCTDQCIAGCFCKPGFTFLDESKKTECVPCNPNPTVHKCPPDQVYNECESACYSPCVQRDPDLMCTQQCIAGCFCKPGFTFLEGSNNAKCVPCNPTPTVPECPLDQEYECRSACYSPCGEIDPDQLCTDECVTGCFCKPGFRFLEGSNKTKCVPCNPIITVPHDECPPDQVYNECGSACYSPCGIMSPNQMCTQQCVPGCFCKPGFTFPEWGDKTRCVPCKFTLRG